MRPFKGIKKTAKVLYLSPYGEAPVFQEQEDAQLIGSCCNISEALKLESQFQNINVIIFASSKDSLQALKDLWFKLPNLEWIHSLEAGVNYILDGVPQLRSSNVTLTNSKGVFDQSLAEFTLFACNYFAKETETYRQAKKDHLWKRVQIQELRGQTIGILGYGDIGRKVALLAKAYQMKVIAIKRRPEEAQHDINSGSIDQVYGTNQLLEVLDQCDYCVNILPRTQQLYKYVSKDAIDKMKPNSVFINIGRGQQVDEEALIEALKAKKIKGAALDVTEVEPLPQDSQLWDLDNVILTFHSACSSGDMFLVCKQLYLEMIKEFTTQKGLRNVVDKQEGY